MKRMLACVAAMGIAGLVALSAAAGGTYVEYVDSDYNRKNAINTGYYVNPKTRIAIDFAYHKFNRGDNPSQSNLQQRVIGLTGGAGSVSFQSYINSGGQYAYSCTNNVNNGWWGLGAGNVTSDRVLISIAIPSRLARVYRDGKRIGAPGAFGPISNTAAYPLGLFACKSANNTTNATSGYFNFGTVRLWSLRIWENDVLVRDFRPYRDENGTYCLKERVSGALHYTVGNTTLDGGEPIDPDGAGPGVATLLPGYNETLNAPVLGGEVSSVLVNGAYGAGGIVHMNPFNWYSGPTYLNSGTLLADTLPNGSVSSLGSAGPLYMDAGTFKFTGGTGTFPRDIVTVRAQPASGADDMRSVIFDVTGDLTLSGIFTNALGGFVKTGPGTLRIPGGSGTVTTLSAIGGDGNLDAAVFHPNGDSAAHGSAFEIIEGTLVLGEKGGTFNINGSQADAWIGKVNVDPRTNPGVQEKSGVLEVRGGTVNVNNWLMIGVKNGFEGSTPEGRPQSGIRVYGGTFDAMVGTALGRNKSSGVYKDAGGNFLQLNTAPFLEVHGGTMRLRNKSARVGICENPGADSRVFVDGGTLIVRNDVNTTGSEMIVGNCTEGDLSQPSVADVTVCTNGTFDVTGFRIVNTSRASVTANLNVIDGGVYRNNQLYKGSTKAGHALNLLVDGGIMEVRWAGYANWIKSDVTKGEIGTHGATFRASADSNSPKNVIDSINITFQAKVTHPDEEPQGVTIGAGVAGLNTGFRFTVPQAWAGPTRIAANGVCELTGTGAFPAASAVTVESKGTLSVATNQTFASLTLGTEGVGGVVTFGVMTNASMTATAFDVKPNTTLAFNLLETIDVSGTAADSPSAYVLAQRGTPLATAGTYALLTVPVAKASDLTALTQSAVVLNPVADTSYSFDVMTDADTATLSVTVASAPAQTVAAVSGETTTVTDPVTGDQTLNTNPTATGGGTVDLGGTLAGFGGRLVSGSGTTTISDLSFVGSAFDWVVGPGTLWYTGAATAVPGLMVDAGANTCGELKIDNDVTIGSAYTLSGSVCKSGAGDLILQGNGYFSLGSVTKSWATNGHIPQPNGDGRTSGFGALNVSEGRIVVGTKNDPSDAPTIDAAGILMVGMRTTETAGETETTGEFVMNNGLLTLTSGINIGYYNGLPATTPEGVTLRPKLTLNGGTISCTSVTLGVDGATGEQTCSPELEVNGGELTFPNNLTIGNQSASEGAVNRITVNDGVLSCKDINFGWAGDNKGCAPGVFEINGGEVRCNTFAVGNKAVSGRQELYLNGGALKCLNITHAGVANALSGAGSAAVYFRGGVFYPGSGRTVNWGCTYGHETADTGRFPSYIGAGGAIFDFSEWEKTGEDAGGMNFRNKFLHDPDCAGTDGGILFRGHGVVSFRAEASGSTFNGPIRLQDRFSLSIDNNWTGYLTTPVICGEGTSLRISAKTNTINTVTLGEAGGTAPVILDFCAGYPDTGLFAHTKMEVLSPVTVAFHYPGGSYNAHGMQDGTYPVVYYKPADDANVPLEMFVANTNFPEKVFTYVKEDVTTGTYAGMRMVKVTIAPTEANATVWTSVSAGGDWSEPANWNGGVPPNGTNSLASFNPATAANVPVTVDGALTLGTATLKGADAASGYTISGGPINLNHRDCRSAPGFTVASGTHVIAADLTTDDYKQRSNDSDANGGHPGAIGIYTASGATARVTGTVTTDAGRPLRVNTLAAGGGRTVFEGTLARGSGVWVNSGTLEMSDMTTLAGKTLTVGPGTFRYTGPAAASPVKVVTNPGNNNYASIMRIDGDLTVAGGFDSQMGGLVKTGPGTLTIAPATGPTVTNRIGYTGRNASWNLTGSAWYWPDNGDCSKTQGSGSLNIDEGEVRLAGPNALFHIANNGNALDCFIGAQDRGWGYTTNYAALTILSGTVRGPWLYLGHTFNHGKDANGHLIPTYSVYNQYGGNVTLSAFCFCYDLSDYDTACQATANLYGGTLNVSGVMRFGQTYNKTGINPPHATFNVYGGTYNHTDTAATKGSRMGYLGDKAGGQKTLNRACDATLNMYGGNYNEIELVHMGCNATTSRLNLHGGVLKAENIILDTSTTTSYCFFSGGKAYIYWNGGIFAPVGTTVANQTLTGLTEVLVSTNGAVVTTAELAGESYTVAQALLHDPDLEGADGGFVKQGAKPLALTGANTYTGDTVVEEGTLEIPAGANASALPAGSAVVVAEGATLSMASGTAARVGGLRFDMGTQYGTLAGFAPAAAGALYVTGVGEQTRKGLVLPGTVTDAQQPNKLTRWAVYVDGDLDDSLSAFVRNNTIVLDGKQGLFIIVK